MTSCFLSRQTKHEKYISYLNSLKDPQFLNIPNTQFENSKYKITISVANPYTCISKFIFISLDQSNKWEANSYRFRICNRDTINIEKIHISLDNRWDSVFNLITSENLTNLSNPNTEIKRLIHEYSNGSNFIASEEEVNYRFQFSFRKKNKTVEMNNIEAYKKWLTDNQIATDALDRSIRLKYLLGLIFDFDTDFRFTK